MENELVMTNDSYIVEESSSQCESESDSMNATEDSDSDTECDVNNSSYNVAIQPVDQAPDLSDVDIIPWSKAMEEENGHFEVDFDTTTSGTKHINSCNKPIVFSSFVLKTVMEPHSYKHKQIWNGPKPLTSERCKCKNNEGIYGHNFQYGFDKKSEINDYCSIRNCLNTPWFRLVMAREQFK